MNVSFPGCRLMRLLAGFASVPCLVLALVAPASAATPGEAITSLPGQLFGVSAVSASDAWAVGTGGTGTLRTLVLHWNGTAWAKVASPSPGTLGRLTAVAAVSRSNAWAVGSYQTSSGGNQTLILHWNGTSWTRVPSPSPEVTDGSFLTGVSAVSASDAWAAGWYYGTGGENSNTLTLHWNGTSWARVPSPNPVHLGFNMLTSASALTASTAWAAGSIDTGTLILRWNGTRWARVPSPGTASPDTLNGISVVSASDAWAAGSTASGTLMLHWDGTSWIRVPSPSPVGATSSLLNSVSALSLSDVWAAGSYSTSSNQAKTLALHWNGVTWTELATPNPGGTNGTSLVSVSATSPGNVWAVGSTPPYSSGGRTVILRWNGTSWTQF